MTSFVAVGLISGRMNTLHTGGDPGLASTIYARSEW
jgi:hypothetical protein